MAGDSHVFELLVEMLESGKSAEEICQNCPDLLTEVRQRWKEFCVVDAEVGALLPDSTLSPNPDALAHPATAAALPQIPGYEVEAILGRGGMGVVYKARHRALDRAVAIKMLLAGGFAAPQELTRFRREAEALAGLRHPNIVQVYDAGDVEGRPYFTMEFIEGGSLAHQLSATPQPPRQAAELITTLAGAVQCAHINGILHRDLKPANIMRTADGVPKIADFGLARSIRGGSEFTLPGARVGTPSYMAPEQALGKTDAIGPAADVYALGAVLYELLTGRPPFRGESPSETERQVIADEPASPSRWNDRVPRDLETICLKCLEKNPGRRYASAQDLADDLERFLKNKPVLARPVGWGERGLRWAQRNKGLSAALLGVALLLLFLAVGSLAAAVYFQRLAREKGNLADEKEAARAEAVGAERREAGLRQLAETQREALGRNLYIAEMNLAGQAATSPSGISRVGELLAVAGKDRPDLRNWEWYYLNGLCHRDLLTFGGHGGSALAVAWSPDGRRVASADARGVIQLWDAADGQGLRLLRGSQSAVRSVAWSPDGTRLASADWNGTARVWDTANGKQVVSYRGHAGAVFAVAWSPDGKWLASGGEDKTIHVWDAANGKNVSVLRGHGGQVFGVAWSPDGKRVASASEDSTVRLWDPLNGKESSTLRGHLNWVNSVAWNPNGERLASASNDGTTKVWEASSGKELLTLRGHAQSVVSVAWSPDGTRLVTASDDRTVKVWPGTGGQEAFTLRGHTDRCTAVAWSPDGKRLASAANDAMVKIWDASAGPETLVLHGGGRPVESLAWRPDGQRFAWCRNEKIAVWDRSPVKELFVLRGHRGPVFSVTWSPDGKRLASGGEDQTVRIWDAARRLETNSLRGHTHFVTSVSWSPDGTRLASASRDKTMRIWDTLSGKPVQICRGHDHIVDGVMWSPDAKRLASASWDRTVRVWEAETGRQTLCLRGHLAEVNAVAWSRDGEWLASAGFDGELKIWNATTGKLKFTLRGHTAQATSAAWNGDGTRLASSSWDGTVKIWDTATGSETLTLRGYANQMKSLAWSPDGLVIVSGGDDQTIVVNDATTGYVAGRAPQYLFVLDRRLVADAKNAADWRLRGEIDAAAGNWNQAAVDFQKHCSLDPRNHWVTLGWWVAGPYPEDLKGHYPPESSPFPDELPAGGVESNAAPRWERVPINACGFVNLGALFSHAEHISAYALLRIYSPRQQQVSILLGSDDQVRLWLNGKQIHESLHERTAVPDAEAVPAALEAGWNTLLARVVNVTGDHALYLRLSHTTTN
jgi:WD40 repeat protein